MRQDDIQEMVDRYNADRIDEDDPKMTFSEMEAIVTE